LNEDEALASLLAFDELAEFEGKLTLGKL